ncbi:MAG: asparagine--tRNA ligase, partial [Methanobacteriota archaeon]
EIMQLEENLVTYICKKVVEENQAELETIGREFKPPTPPYPRITYKEAIDLLQKNGIEIEPGDDFGAEAERFLSMKHDKPFFVTGYPVSARAFYHMPDPDDPGYTLSSDMMAPEGYGELTSGGQRIHDAEQLVQRIRECNLDPKDYSWYLDLRRYGTPPHAGFGLGIERLVSWICGLDHIRDACLFPRTPSRLTP